MTDEIEITRLEWSDPEFGGIDLPERRLEIRAGFGSGLAVRAPASPGTVWAVCDRGPNIKVKTAVERFGLAELQHLAERDGAKIMPRLDLGPAIAELRVGETAVELVRSVRLTASGKPVSGLPLPGGDHASREPALDLDGRDLGADPTGADTEGIAALSDGGFWVSDEYGPSLLRVDAEGRLLMRWVPAGDESALQGCGYPVSGCLPAIAGRRKLNRGFEALALSPDERWLWLAFQSPLAHPDSAAHERARHVRLWKLDIADGRVEAQYLYPLDPPESFRRDSAREKVKWSDLKISEMTACTEQALLVLERGSETTKIYRIEPTAAHALPAEHLEPDVRPTVEEMSGAGSLDLPVLEKRLLFSSDDHPLVAADLEGMALLSPSELLLVSDNDFGVEGAETSFWRLRFAGPIV